MQNALIDGFVYMYSTDFTAARIHALRFLAYLQVLPPGGPLQLPVPEQHSVSGSQSPFFGTHAVVGDELGCAEGSAVGDQVVVEGCALGCGVGCGGGAPALRWLSKKLSMVSTT